MRKILPLLILLLSSTLLAQKADAREQLQTLKNSALLVRLQTKSMSINALEEAGRTKEAEKVREALYLENKEIVLSFRNNFAFCPVYFFYADNADAISEGDLAGKVFDSNFHLVDPSAIPDSFFTAAFTTTPRMKMEALLIMDHEMRPLEEPFPFYQRQHVFFSLVKLSKAQMIARLDHRLQETYALWMAQK